MPRRNAQGQVVNQEVFTSAGHLQEFWRTDPLCCWHRQDATQNVRRNQHIVKYKLVLCPSGAGAYANRKPPLARQQLQPDVPLRLRTPFLEHGFPRPDSSDKPPPLFSRHSPGAARMNEHTDRRATASCASPPVPLFPCTAHGTEEEKASLRGGSDQSHAARIHRKARPELLATDGRVNSLVAGSCPALSTPPTAGNVWAYRPTKRLAGASTEQRRCPPILPELPNPGPAGRREQTSRPT